MRILFALSVMYSFCGSTAFAEDTRNYLEFEPIAFQRQVGRSGADLEEWEVLMVGVGHTIRASRFLLYVVAAYGYEFYGGQDTSGGSQPPAFSIPLQIRAGSLLAFRGLERISPIVRLETGGEYDLPFGGFAVSGGASIGLRLPGISIFKRDPAVSMQILATGLLSYQWDIGLEPRGTFTGGAISVAWDVDPGRL